MLGGSAEPSKYPSVDSWIKIIKNLDEVYKDIRVYLTGIINGIEGRTNTQGYKRSDLEKILSVSDNIVDCYDIGFWNQLALIKQSNVFISPHTGFAFLAPCVETPWLSISGREWPEYLFNRIPFYCVIPDCRKYPCYDNMKKGCMERINVRKKVICMDKRAIENKIEDILKGVKLLMDKKFTYKKALSLHMKNIKKLKIDKDKIFSFDRVLK